VIARLALRYLLVFAVVLALLSAGAYAFMSGEYQSLMQPLIGTPEGAQGYRTAMARVLETILSFDIPLLAIVGGASWLLARASLQPLIAGEDPPPYRDGLPAYVRIRGVPVRRRLKSTFKL